ncbi:MAG TPA: RsmE family RNA methyltransferase [bacterium]|nr:RsmE family RNA methyltransferase [bacterium]
MSFIPRLFLKKVAADRTEVRLEASASSYLLKVLRFSEGAPLKGFDESGHEYDMILVDTDPEAAMVRIVSRKGPSSQTTGARITLAQSLPKASKMDLVLRQGCEAGADGFIPFLSRRSVSRPDPAQFGHKNDRWGKILVEACRQSGRNQVPGLDPVTEWEDLLARFKDFDLVLLPYEKEAPTLRTVLESKSKAGKILVLVGPEGGWDPDEVREAELQGALAVHLPTPILRTETAGVSILSMLQFFYGGISPMGA